MNLHADLTLPAMLLPEAHVWVPSPQAGVERVMLDRQGAEHGRATSLVRYAPGSVFPPHAHPGGEEILVLAGTFADESGTYGSGWYLRNPPGSRHQPSSTDGALIFVKLWQMGSTPSPTVRQNTADPSAWTTDTSRQWCPLYADAHEQVWLERLTPGSGLVPNTYGGVELLVVAGSLQTEAQTLSQHSWLRCPPGGRCDVRAGALGATVYLKTGHLAGEVIRQSCMR